MAPNVEEDWSDSDDESPSEVETSVTLGVPDGPLDAPVDAADAAVSRIGGLPAFLVSPEPSISSSSCKVCHKSMELLVQMWCPMEDSPLDRAMYVWGCSSSACQKKPGSVRAWRGIRYNSEYAVKLEKKLAQRREREAAKAKAQEKKTVPAPNPFSMSTGPAAASNPFSLGNQIFGATGQPEHESHAPIVAEEDSGDVDDVDDGASDTGSDSSEHSLVTALATTTLEDSPWKSAPHYPPQYMSIDAEYIVPETKPKYPSAADVLDAADDANDNDKGTSWKSEAYENSLDIDQIFDRFSKRVQSEPEQCVRYDLGGIPLMFSKGASFDVVFPPPPAETVFSVTRGDFKASRPAKREYTSANIPPCPSCSGPRVFECQLMPNLINVLRDISADRTAKLSDDERRKLVEEELKGTATEKSMDWGTVVVFSCKNDCGADKQKKYGWCEEHVLVQWDE
ncbi:hypothetical protein CYLTODRAFT_364813 [Cylindrobasidium torrendii FP15055 ss-10]|uniref:Programmed cell death protein 2 C-terminal domain-containing protein n=1 Tax=Cylindrobasidium torrendii FP15055 ss-10 TaxID=1314674 RepID=A0A0D7BUF3_9AGAR|nr:hypothetical protein CYLTODRAFT_364813 [Cylindrobasidium torrendii FP15055 ss-10]